MTTAEIN